MKSRLVPAAAVSLHRAAALCLLTGLFSSDLLAAYPDRLVWIFGWGLGSDSDVTEVAKTIETGARHGINGAVVSFGLDSLCKRDAEYFRRLDAVREACERNQVELIPSVFWIGYGGGILSHDRNLAEGLPVADAPFVVRGTEARLEPDAAVRLVNGGFEESTNHRLKGCGFHDQPGEVSFADPQVKHGGNASLRLESFTANARKAMRSDPYCLQMAETQAISRRGPSCIHSRAYGHRALCAG